MVLRRGTLVSVTQGFVRIMAKFGRLWHCHEAWLTRPKGSQMVTDFIKGESFSGLIPDKQHPLAPLPGRN